MGCGAAGVPLVQLCTWNDWGEGTQVEPSHEYGYRDLEVVQATRAAASGERPRPEDLRLPARLFALRKTAGRDAATLDRIAALLAARKADEARAALDALDGSRPR